jgi:HPt (histidine-containing phosphotransfer) domain-containing protein
MNPPPTATAIRSSLAQDPDLGEIVQMFVEEMPQRVEALERCRLAAEWEDVGRIAHQLKGAAGSYGFHELTPLAARLEAAIRIDHAYDRAPLLLDELLDACRRVRGVD